MADFFKQLITQLSAVWNKLSLTQKIITASLVGFTLLGLIFLMFWSSGTATETGFKKLYSDLELEEASLITEKLDQGGYKYKLEQGGKTILVKAKQVYEIRMALARDGLPTSHGVGYEIFDKTSIGVTDFVQKLNARRALEGELQRTIEGLDEVHSTRIHIVIPEPTIFLERQKEPTASVVIKMNPGKTLSKDQVRGITNLVSSSVEGLKANNISIVDFEGRLLSNPYGDDETALASSRNMELQHNIERALERKIDNLMLDVLGPGKATVQVAVDLDFDQVEKTMEKYDPESRVVRSEERSDENVKNAPDGDQQQERSLTNYEIDKTVEHLIQEVGNIRRLTISVAVDGRYRKDDEGKDIYESRSTEELANIEDIVKNAVGYDLARGDQIVVASMKFDNEYMRKEQESIDKKEQWAFRMMIAKYIIAFIVGIMVILLIRYLAKTLAEAMNPPVPQVEIGAVEEEIPIEVPEDVRKSNELLERVELMTQQEPINIAAIIREWLMEPMGGKKKI